MSDSKPSDRTSSEEIDPTVFEAGDADITAPENVGTGEQFDEISAFSDQPDADPGLANTGLTPGGLSSPGSGTSATPADPEFAPVDESAEDDIAKLEGNPEMELA